MAKQNLPHKLKIGKFIDPLTDFGFKLLFGSEPNKDLLIAFLNELFFSGSCTMLYILLC